ncbi:MaoC family dehydratase [Myxococcota bacterium]|nr:MaoC family dehydratase [Myxococcota bacterium]
MSEKLNRISKTTGNFLEDFRPGQHFRHKGGKTITEGIFTTFTEYTMTTNPLSKNSRYAQALGFRDLVCPPGLVMLVAFSQTVEDISENARANLEYINMRFGSPVYIGDTIEVETKVLGVRPSKSRPNLGIVHVQSTACKNIGDHDEAIVATWERKVQVYKNLEDAEVHPGQIDGDTIECEPSLPAYSEAIKRSNISHLTNRDSYFEDFEPGTLIEHSRGRVVTDEHIHMTAILDNTSQVHCNKHMIDKNPEQYVGGKLIIYGGIPFVLCLGLSCPDIGDNAIGDLIYKTGSHSAPLFSGETVYAETEILSKKDFSGRPDLGVVETRLTGHKFERDQAKIDEWNKTQIFSLDRDLILKKRSHYLE